MKEDVRDDVPMVRDLPVVLWALYNSMHESGEKTT